VRGLCAMEPLWVVKRDIRFFVAEDHLEALMRWILDRSREDIKPEEKLLNSHKEYLLRLPIRNASSFRCEVIL
jgi:hypothetical protein